MKLETARLIIRAFETVDLETVHRILEQTFGDGMALPERQAWLHWSQLNDEWFPRMHQTPYGDRAIVLKATSEVIGAVGYVPVHAPFDQIPEVRGTSEVSGNFTTEVGLFWTIDPRHQRQGYASEAAQAMVDYAFKELRLKRIIAMTEYDNLASQAVMRKAGMTLTRNPQPEPPWLQVVGVLENDTDRRER
ncbi:MAG: GNAT family N-acetyltransferase [Chloroflexi bacterium]|nr:GNAT family N-acetyltransferase [Chloroflexota bacterium]